MQQGSGSAPAAHNGRRKVGAVRSAKRAGAFFFFCLRRAVGVGAEAWRKMSPAGFASIPESWLR